MKLWPALDLREGRCVRLRQGDYARETVYGDDPAAVARSFVAQGAEGLHLVDLDGAKAGRPVNGAAVADIARASGVPCQLGGGLRTDADVEAAFSWGVARLIIGSRALSDPAWLARLAQRYPQRILLGLDVLDGQVATGGWLEHSQVGPAEVLASVADLPLAGVIATDIRRDGMLQGPNLPFLEQLLSQTRHPLIASGGVTTLDDLRALLRLPLAGCIVGRALYEKTLDLPAALALLRAA